MSDIDTYLTQLRAHLTDLHPKRADEIVAEARTHLESRAAQLRVGGMDDIEASAEAARTFGDPSQVAQDLIQSNARHRRPVALRVVAALVTAFGSIFVLSSLVSWVVILSEMGVVTLPADLDLESTTWIVTYLGYCGIALLTGIVAGRRFWWIATLPGFLVVGFSLLVHLLLLPAAGVKSGASLLGTLAWGVVFAVIMASLGWLGSRLPRRRRLSTAITIVSGSVVGLIWVGLVVLVVAASKKTEAVAWYSGSLLAAVMPVALALLIAGRHDRFLRRETFIALLSTVCGIGLLLTIGTALIFVGEGPGALRQAQPWITIAALASALGLLGALIYWRRTQPEPSPGQSNLPPASGHPG